MPASTPVLGSWYGRFLLLLMPSCSLHGWSDQEANNIGEKMEPTPQEKNKTTAPKSDAQLDTHAKPKTTKPTQRQKSKFWLTALTLGSLAFGGWLFYPAAAPDVDDLTQDEIQQIQQTFEAKGHLEVERIKNPEEINQAITSMGLDPEKTQVLQEKVDKGELEIAWLQAWDNMAEDGDVLQFQSQGYGVTATLTNQPVIFALPLLPGQNQVMVTGVYDGGGGITASVVTSAGATSVPVIQTGQSYTLPLR